MSQRPQALALAGNTWVKRFEGMLHNVEHALEAVVEVRQGLGLSQLVH